LTVSTGTHDSGQLAASATTATALADRVVAELGPRTVLEVGCGAGHLVAALRARGVEAWGVDPSCEALARAVEAARPFCRAAPILEAPGRRYDLVVCLGLHEEELAPEEVAQAMDRLCEASDDVLVALPPVDCARHRAAWAEAFAARGYHRDLAFDAAPLEQLVGGLARFRAGEAAAAVRAYERRLAELEGEGGDLRAALEEARAEAERLRRSTLAHRRELEAQVREARMEVAALRASQSWRVTRPLRVANELLGTVQARLTTRPRRDEREDHATWARRHADPGPEERAWIAAWIAARRGALPTISVLLPMCDPPPELLRRALESVRGQLYPGWQLCVADDASTSPEVHALLEAAERADPRVRVVRRTERGHVSATTNSALALAEGEWCVLLDHDDELAPHALFCVAAEAVVHPEVELLYSDEDKLDAEGTRCDPSFKPEWDLELLRGCNYVCHLLALRTARVRALGGLRLGLEGAQDYDLVLRYGERLRPAQVRRLPFVLYHWRAWARSTALSPDAKPYAGPAARRAVTEHLARTRVRAVVEPHPRDPTWSRVRYEVPSPPPLASLIVPTRDGLELLRTCVESLRRTTYPAWELLVVDNGSQEAATLDYLAELERLGTARVLRDPSPFNYSDLNNAGAAAARGQVLVLLNNDTEVVSPDWLTELVSHVMRPDVGAAGPLLVYPDGTIQHAGVVVGFGGIAGHVLSKRSPDASGLGGRALLARSYTACTAACLAVRADVYRAVGGLDPEFAVALGDVDLCVRIRERGLKVVWTPYVRLLHHESATRGSDETAENSGRFGREADRFRRRWPGWIADDPAWSPWALRRRSAGLAATDDAPRPVRGAVTDVRA
jgi:GT2 family glycosyltransferase/SAM-dependent methyltransferase